MTREEQIRQAAKKAEKEDGFTQIVKYIKGVNSAYGIGFAEGAKWSDETHGKELMYAIQKTGERTKREIINKACEWLKENIDLYSYTIRNVKTGYTEITLTDEFETAFRKAMEE